MISAVALRAWLPEQKRAGASLRKQKSFSSAAAVRVGRALRVTATRSAHTPSAIFAISSVLLPAYCAGPIGTAAKDAGKAGSGDTTRSLTSLKSGKAAVRCTE